MAEELTLQQKQAVYDRGGMLLVSAAAGSGKTKVLVDRLMSYVLDSSAPAELDDFLIITYTKAAAAELREKISKKLTELIAQNPENTHLHRQMTKLYLAKISTVHSFCSDVLREYAYRLDIPVDFRVAEQVECTQLQLKALEDVLEQAYINAGENPAFRALVDTQGFGRNDRQIQQIILKVYESAICHLNPGQWLQQCAEKTCVADIVDAGQTAWGRYIIQEFHNTVKLHIQALNHCITAAVGADGFEKPVALLGQTIAQLTNLAQCNTWDEIVNFGAIDYGTLRFPKNCSDLALAEQIKAVRNTCKNDIAKKYSVFANDSQQVLADLMQSGLAVAGLVELVEAFSQRYAALKRSRRILDFTDLEQRTLDLLLGKNRTAPTAAADEIGRRFREIMVDEYQDSNGVQDAIFSAITQNNNCFMVGDVKQSIYQFRLADPEIFIEKYNHYVMAENACPGQGRKVLLSSNFRSSQGVISGVNDVFRVCMSPQVGGLAYGEEEMLNEGIPHISLDEPEVELYGIDVECDTYAEEAAFVAHRITQLLDGKHMVRQKDTLRPIRPSDIVILLRSPGSVGGEFLYALSQVGITCNMDSGGDLFSAPELVTLLNILQIIDNPLQDIPLVSALMSPVFAFTAEDMAKIRSSSRKTDLFTAVKNDDSDKAVAFLEILGQLRDDAKMTSVSQLILQVLNKTNLLSIYQSMEDGKQRADNLYAFCQMAADYENTSHRDLHSFLEYIGLLRESGSMAMQSAQDANAVTIMSIHKSKGLEFPVVILAGLSRRFNQMDAAAPVLCHKQLGLGLSCVNAKQRVRYPSVAKSAIAAEILSNGVSEELRVLYVAMTRARDRLIMTYAAKNLESDLQDIALRLRHTPKALMTRAVSCPGEWVLQAAMRRTEAGALFALGGNPNVASVSNSPWLIQVVSGVVSDRVIAASDDASEEISQEIIEKLQSGLRFQYPFETATQLPSKQTATQLKGRFKDQEISQGTTSVSSRKFCRGFQELSVISGTEYGTAMHTLMQYIHFDRCDDEASVQQEAQRLVQAGLLTQKQYEGLSFAQVCRFFASNVGRRLRAHPNVLREFKFSLLIDSGDFDNTLQGEKVLLQGIADSAMIDDDGIVLLDFKTDYVTQETLCQKVAAYAPQVKAYAKALEKIFQLPVKSAQLYFFRLDTFEEIAL